MLKKLLKEPLLYFFVLGFVVFGLHSLLNRENQEGVQDPLTLEVTSADIEWIRSSWEASMKRQPTQQELQQLINNYIHDEILQREALAMGMDEKDLVIKNRLVQKYTFVFEDIAGTIEPSDVELEKYLQENREKYLIPGKLSFTHVYFNPEKRKDVFKEAQSILARLISEHITPEKASMFGDNFMMETSFRKSSPSEVAKNLGQEFTDKLFSSQEMGWQGPIASTFGQHLVYIEEHIVSEIPELARVREIVKNDFIYDRKKEIMDNTYNAIKSKYTILVEGLPHE